MKTSGWNFNLWERKDKGLQAIRKSITSWIFAIPFGGGNKILLPGRWQLGVEIGARKLFTDYLDDVSNQQVVYEDVLNGNGPLAAQLSNPNFDPDTTPLQTTYVRGKEANDWYYIGGLTISYLISEGGSGGKDVKCYSF